MEPITYTPDQALEVIGFGPMQWGVFLGTGLVWAADACSVMLMSFLGPAVGNQLKRNSSMNDGCTCTCCMRCHPCTLCMLLAA